MKSAPTAAPRDRMIEAAIVLMRRSGYSGVGINEVLAESAAPKGSMYHYFPGGKRQVAAEALATYATRVVAFIDESLARGTTPADKMRKLFAAFARRLEGFGYRQSCAAGCVSLDLDADLDEVRAQVAAAFSAYVDVIATHLGIADRRRARSFAGFVLTAIEGAYVRGRAEHSSAAFREAGQWLAELAEAAAPQRAR
jgi:TetR/AcrR family transcriptional repressor of lmrAB and yxaGH operons